MSNWETAQTVTEADDGNTARGNATITHTVGGYSGSAPFVTVNEVEELTGATRRWRIR